MNEFEAMQYLVQEWKAVERKSKKCQELYDLLGGALLYTVRYARKNNIPLPNFDALDRMVECIHLKIEEFNEPTTTNLAVADETLQGGKPDGDLTEPRKLVLLYCKSARL